MTRKQLNEKFWFEKFLPYLNECYGITIKDANHFDKPDFDFSIGDTRVGLEITERDEIDTGNKKWQAIRPFQSGIEKFTDNVAFRIYQKTGFKILITINFCRNAPFKLRNIHGFVEKLSIMCIDELKQMENKQFHWMFNTGNMPYEIYSVSFVRYDRLTKSVNGNVLQIESTPLSIETIQRSIKEKVEKLKSYRTFDQQWLLIADSAGKEGSFSEHNNSNENAGFDRIFIFR